MGRARRAVEQGPRARAVGRGQTRLGSDFVAPAAQHVMTAPIAASGKGQPCLVTNAEVAYAPSPTNAPWPSETCPASPVIKQSPAMATIQTIACLTDTCPEGMGRERVRATLSSMSRSNHMLMVLAPPAIR